MASSWKARWIWTADGSEQPNSYVLFRRMFDSPGRTDAWRTALLRVTAGHFCHIYLNGRLLGRGPDRCYFREKICHTYHVDKWLKKGRNVLAIEVHFLGESFESLMSRHAAGPAGLLAQMDLNGKPFLWTDGAWKVRSDPAYAKTETFPSMHRGWREVYRAGQALRGWQGGAFDDRDWSQAQVVAPAEGGPWTKLVAKETPELTATPMPPLNMHITNAGGSGDTEYDHFRMFNILSKGSGRLPGDFALRSEQQEPQEILFDMGCVVAGYPRIEIADSLGGTLQVYYGDSLSMTHWDTIHLGRGPLTWSPFTSRGGRYMRLVVTGARNPVVFRSVRWIRTNYPVRKRGSFRCSDERLNRIWRMCALSAETCGMEHFTDCVGREQVLWMMDFRFQAPQHAYYFGDVALARKCFRQFAALQLDNGHILGYGPSCRAKELFPKSGRGCARDWFGANFFFLIAVLEHYRYTGDKEFLRELYPVCRRTMEYYEAHEKDGFAALGSVSGSYFVDWGYPVPIRGICGFSQPLYYGALRALSAQAAALGRPAESRQAARRAARLEKRFFEVFTDPRTGRVADCVEDGRRHVRDALQPHAAVLRFFDHIPGKVLRASLEGVAGRRCAPAITGLGNTLAAEALLRHGRRQEALDLIGDYWGAMLDAGLPQTPEVFDMTQPRGADTRWHPSYSRCHSYASMAGVLLQQSVLGARVEGRLVTLSPFFGRLDHAGGDVPTVGGDVRVAWRRERSRIRLTASAPRGVEVRFEPLDPDEPVAFRRRERSTDARLS